MQTEKLWWDVEADEVIDTLGGIFAYDRTQKRLSVLPTNHHGKRIWDARHLRARRP